MKDLLTKSPFENSSQAPLSLLLEWACQPWPRRTNTNTVSKSSRLHLKKDPNPPCKNLPEKAQRCPKSLVFVPANAWKLGPCPHLPGPVGGGNWVISTRLQILPMDQYPLLLLVIFPFPRSIAPHAPSPHTLVLPLKRDIASTQIQAVLNPPGLSSHCNGALPKKIYA